MCVFINSHCNEIKRTESADELITQGNLRHEGLGFILVQKW